MNNADMPAMPIFDENAKPCIVRDLDSKDKKEVPATGLTKREMFAMYAMQGLCSMELEMAKVYIKSSGGDDITNILAKMSVEYADALLAELEK